MLATHTPSQVQGCEEPDDWAWHVNRLSTVIQLRGSSQFETKRGRDLFWIALCYIVRQHCRLCPVHAQADSGSGLTSD